MAASRRLPCAAVGFVRSASHCCVAAARLGELDIGNAQTTTGHQVKVLKGKPAVFFTKLDVFGCATHIFPSTVGKGRLQTHAIELAIAQKDQAHCENQPAQVPKDAHGTKLASIALLLSVSGLLPESALQRLPQSTLNRDLQPENSWTAGSAKQIPGLGVWAKVPVLDGGHFSYANFYDPYESVRGLLGVNKNFGVFARPVM